MTPYNTIYRLFLSRIRSLAMGQLIVKEKSIAESVMRELLENAVFDCMEYLKTDLSGNGHSFAEEIGFEESHFLAEAMAIRWLGSILMDEDLMRVAIGDRDWKETEGWRIVRALAPIHERAERKLRTRLKRYTRREFKRGDY